MLPPLNLDTAKKFLRLMVGLYIYGWGIALMVHASIGIAPWDVFAQGISHQTGLTFGISSVVVSLLVLICWIPVKVKALGIGTILNGIFIGVFCDLSMPLLPTWPNLLTQYLTFIAGIVTVAFATGLYISSKLGSGPRDGLMVGLSKLTNRPLWILRTATEATVLLIGWLMGGQVGFGTIIFAICIGPLMQLSLRLFKYPTHRDVEQA